MDYQALVLKRVGDEFQLLQITCKNADKGKPEEVKTLATLKATEKDKVDYQPAIHCDAYLRLKVSYVGGKNADGTNKHEASVEFAWSKDGKKYENVGDKFTMRQGKWMKDRIHKITTITAAAQSMVNAIRAIILRLLAKDMV